MRWFTFLAIGVYEGPEGKTRHTIFGTLTLDGGFHGMRPRS
jgi:hypothetical protein